MFFEDFLVILIRICLYFIVYVKVIKFYIYNNRNFFLVVRYKLKDCWFID